MPDRPPHRPGCCDEAHTRPAALDLTRWLWPLRSRRGFLKAMLATLAAPAVARAVQDAGPCGLPPPPKPAQASAAEGVPPLPLPVTPQRRSEKKNPPRPPVIAVKIVTGERNDWGTDPNDLNNLLIWMKAQLGVNFTYDEKPLAQINLEDHEVPVLYRSGHHAFQFSAGERQRLRNYLLRGGMMIFDACCGKQEFADSARREIAAILPEHPLRPVAMDHPLFHCYFQNAGLVRFTPISGLRSPGPSAIEGVEIACRLAVAFSPHDLSCGWDMHTHTISGNTYIESEDALKIGANTIAYATATRDMSVSAADARAYRDAEPTTTDKFRVGQIVHEGDWNPDPVGLRNLLDTVGQTTALKVSFATEPVKVEADVLSRFPFLYLTGHDEFRWDEAQAAAMRRYLANGGFLLADACCGRQKFDLAFRREIGKALGGGAGGTLQALPVNHPLYAAQHQIKSVGYTQAAEFRAAGAAAGGAANVPAAAGRLGDSPRLEGAGVGGRLAVVYSPLALNVGWRLKNVPYAVGYAPKSALELGVNTVMYVLTQ